MVKVVKEGKVKQNHTPPNKIKQTALRKPVKNVSYKRLTMLRRRLNNLYEEKSSWEIKNKELSDTLRAEQLVSATLRKESFRWQKICHESAVTNNMYKVKQAEMAQVIATSLRELNSIYPNMVAFSESVTNNKIRLTNLLNSLTSPDYDCLPRKSDKSGCGTNNTNDKHWHRVGPMVKGHPIIKPKIMLTRVTMPQPQEQDADQVNSDASATEENIQLTPIPEENERSENDCLRHISIRPKRSKLGTLCRMRRQEKERDKEKKSPVAVAYDSSDSEATVEPVVRFKDISRLFQNSSVIKMDCGEGGGSSERRRCVSSLPKSSDDDPLEGSSWMHNNNHKRRAAVYIPSHNTLGRRSSLYKSDDSSEDDESAVIKQKKSSITSPMKSLLLQNETFTVSKNKSIPADNSHEDLESSLLAEPDSTNNIDINSEIENNISSKDTSKIGTRNSSSCYPDNIRSSNNSYSLSTEYDSTEHVQEQKKLSKNRLTIRLSKVPDRISFDSVNNTTEQSLNKRRSSVCDSRNPASPEVTGKRIRKPKNILYPGEEVFDPLPKTSKIPRVSTLRKSSCEKKKESPNEQAKRVSTEMASTSEDNAVGSSKKSGKRKTAITGDKLQKSKKSSLKKSIPTPRGSSVGGSYNSMLDCESANRPRRIKTAINYKESPLNVKQRRP